MVEESEGPAPSGEPAWQSFDYSPDEWAKIEECIYPIRPSPLTGDERRFLVATAKRYLKGIALRASGSYLTPAKRAHLWKKVAKLAVLLREALQIAAQNRYGEYWRKNPALFLDNIEDDSQLHVLARALFSVSNDGYVGYINSGPMVEMIYALEKSADKLCNLEYAIEARQRAMSGRQDPHLIFMREVLWLWSEVFGGILRKSRAPDTGKVRGPLSRYFVAVIAPVMGERTPPPETFADAVERQKLYNEQVHKLRARLKGQLSRDELVAAHLIEFGRSP